MANKQNPATPFQLNPGMLQPKMGYSAAPNPVNLPPQSRTSSDISGVEQGYNTGTTSSGGGVISTVKGFFRRVFPGGPLQGEYGVDSSVSIIQPLESQPVPEPQPIQRPLQTTSSLGGTGVPNYAGFVTDLGEYNSSWQGLSGFEICDKMRRGDPDVHAGLQAIKLPIRSAQYQIVPGAAENETDRKFALEIANFVEDNMFGGLETMTSTGFYQSQPFEEVIENALLSLDFGCACHEILWTVDGSKIRVRKLAPRLPSTYFRFWNDRDGETLLALEQYGYRGGSYINVVLPAEKLDFFTHDKEGSYWYGRSALRYCYASWYIKSQLYRIDAIALERNGMGVPVIILSENATDEDKQAALSFVTNVNTHEQVGIVIPFGWDFKFVGTTGRLRDPAKSIQHQSEQTLRSFLAGFMAFGTTQTGARAVGAEMTGFFKQGLNAVARKMTETINNGTIRRLVDYNFGDTRKRIPYPKLVHSNIAVTDPMELIDKVKGLTQWQSDVIQPDDELENSLRVMMGLPLKSKMRVRWMPLQTRLMEQPEFPTTPEELETGEPPSPTEEVGPQKIETDVSAGGIKGGPKEGVATHTKRTESDVPLGSPPKGQTGAEGEPAPKVPIASAKQPPSPPSAAKINASENEGVEVSNEPGGILLRDWDNDVGASWQIVLLLSDKMAENTVVFDFDGVISIYPGEKHQYVPGKFGECSKNAVALAKLLKESNIRVAVVTARKDLPETEAFLRANGFPFDSLGNEKVAALAYLDDRGVHIDWQADYSKASVERVMAAIKAIVSSHAGEMPAVRKIAKEEEKVKAAETRSVSFQKLPIQIENEVGSTRTGIDPVTGNAFMNKFTHAYGYIGNTVGLDGDPIDVFLGDNENATHAYVIDAEELVGKGISEKKVFLGFNSEAEATKAFLENYDNPSHLGVVTPMQMQQFYDWIGYQVAAPTTAAANPGTKMADRLNKGISGDGAMVYFIRHAPSLENDEQDEKVRGSLDLEPTEEGKKGALAVGDEFAGISIKQVFTSPSKRARIVAEAISKTTGAPIAKHDGLSSWKRGTMEGKPISEVKDQLDHLLEQPDEVPPNGISHDQFAQTAAAETQSLMGIAEKAGGPIAAVTHHSFLLNLPASVTGDKSLRPMPKDKISPLEMVVLEKKNGTWRWKKHVHLTDCIKPVDIKGYNKMVDKTTSFVAAILRDSLPGTALLAANVLITGQHGGDDAFLPHDSQLAYNLKEALEPAYNYGRDSVYHEREQATGRPRALPPHAGSGSPVLAASQPQSIFDLANTGTFNFATWVLSRQMAGLDPDEYPDPDDYSIEGDLWRATLDGAGLPVKQLARDLVHATIYSGRLSAFKELQSEVTAIKMASGIPIGEFE